MLPGAPGDIQAAHVPPPVVRVLLWSIRRPPTEDRAIQAAPVAKAHSVLPSDEPKEINEEQFQIETVILALKVSDPGRGMGRGRSGWGEGAGPPCPPPPAAPTPGRYTKATAQ